MTSNLHKIIIFWCFKGEILDLEISKLYILISHFNEPKAGKFRAKTKP